MGAQPSSDARERSEQVHRTVSHRLSGDLDHAANTNGGTYIQPPTGQRLTPPRSKSPKSPKKGKAAHNGATNTVVFDSFPRLVPATVVSSADTVSAVAAGLDANTRPLRESDYAHFCAGVKATHRERSPAAAAGKARPNRSIRAQRGIQQPSGSNH